MVNLRRPHTLISHDEKTTATKSSSGRDCNANTGSVSNKRRRPSAMADNDALLLRLRGGGDGHGHPAAAAAAAAPPPPPRPPPRSRAPPPPSSSSRSHPPPSAPSATTCTGTGAAEAAGGYAVIDQGTFAETQPLLGTPRVSQEGCGRLGSTAAAEAGAAAAPPAPGAPSRRAREGTAAPAMAAGTGSGEGGNEDPTSDAALIPDNGANGPSRDTPAAATAAILSIRCPAPPPSPQQESLRAMPQLTADGKMGNGDLRQRKGGGHYHQQQHFAVPQQPKQPRPREGPIVQVLVPTHGPDSTSITERELGRCIVQATGIGIAPPTADGLSWVGWQWEALGGYNPYSSRQLHGANVLGGGGGGGGDSDADADADAAVIEAPLAGLFRVRDGLFLPLSYILINAKPLERELLSVTRPLPRPRPTPPPPPIVWPYIVVASLMALYIVLQHVLDVDWEYVVDRMFHCAETLFMDLLHLPTKIVHTLVDLPLRESYRWGPGFIGWEGQPLAAICAQITFHGDEAFWSRNMQECERIYAAKEAAALHVRKPILFIAVATGLFLAIQSLVRTHAIRKQYRPDRNMLETYNAFNVLLRQIQRAGMQMRR